jgi:hypothetical protein
MGTQTKRQNLNIAAKFRAASSGAIMNPTVFMSYAWENDDHTEWVKDLAIRLRGDGVDVLLDRWHVPPGGDLTAFMEQSLHRSSFVLLICTPTYKLRSDERAGGVGYEGAIITGAILTGTPQTKFIPLLRSAEWKEAGPARLLGARYLDFRGSPYNDLRYDELLRTIMGRPEHLPPLGELPFPPSESTSKETSQRTTLLLSAAQDHAESLARTIAEVLAFSTESGDQSLRIFCERELSGLAAGTIIDKRDPNFPSHRVYTAYVGLAQQINSQFFMWNGDPERVFQYLDAHPEEFPERKLIEQKPISTLEMEARQAPLKAIRVMKMRAGDLVADFAQPDLPVFAHVRSDTSAKIVEATRGELTRRLLRLSQLTPRLRDTQPKVRRKPK